SSDMGETVTGLSRGIVIDDFGNRRERDLHDLAIGAFDLDARRRQRLRGLHAAHDATDPVAGLRNDLNVSLAVQRPKRRQSTGDFHLRISRMNQYSCDYTLSDCIRKLETR